ncbi:ABC transporter substrate-binding protein [Brucella gallinifaecis]|uniref:ABC transporter substrate-binding protein n=1 Tax=Brucella gallinifaecis TaxID=215590 RepID=UPI002361849B|nr:extracellular solute-binding protein [Brucella gallinifaecis]
MALLRDMSRRSFLKSTAAAAVATTLSAPVVRAQSKRKLLIWHGYTQPARANFQRKLADRFEALNPGLTITVEGVPPPQFHSKVIAARAAGALPDIVFGSSQVLVDYFTSGFLKPVDDLVAELGTDFFLPGQLERFASYNGHSLGLPYHSHARLLQFRRDRLSEAALSAPVTWEDALKAAVSTNVPGQYNGWILPLNQSDSGGADALYTLGLTAGGSFLDNKGNVTFNSAPIRETVEFITEVTRKAGGPSVLDYRVNELFNLVNSGKTSLFLDATPLLGVAEVDAPEIAGLLGAALPPKKTQDGSLVYSTAVATLDGQNTNETDAKAYLKFLLEPQNHQEFLLTIPLFMYPTTKAATGEGFFSHPTVAKYRDAADLSLKAIEVGSAFAADKGGLNPYGGQVLNSRVVEEMFARILTENTSVDEAVEIAHDRISGIVRNIQRRTGN